MRKPKKSGQFKLGLSLGILGFLLWLVNFVLEMRTVFESRSLLPRSEWERAEGDVDLYEQFEERQPDRALGERDRATGLLAEADEAAVRLELTLRVYRRGEEENDSTFTEIRLDDAALPHRLPDAPEGEDATARKARDEALAAIGKAVGKRLARESIQPANVSVEILAAEPEGGSVPSDDIDRLMNILYRLGISDVLYNDGR